MDDINFIKTILNEIFCGKSLRNIEKDYGVNREEIVKQFRKLFSDSEKELEMFEQILAKNVIDNISVKIDEGKLDELINQVISGEITIKEASNVLNINRQTFKQKMIDYINKCDDVDRKKEFIEYLSKLQPDYSFINFKALCIEMIKNDLTQMDMAIEYGIPARTISREIEKFKEDKKYVQLYEICKEYAHRKMQKKKFNSFEMQLIDMVLDEYDEGKIILDEVISNEEKKYRFYLEQIEMAETNGKTNEEKASSIGISVSTYRRMKKYIEEYEMKNKMNDEIEGEEK